MKKPSSAIASDADANADANANADADAAPREQASAPATNTDDVGTATSSGATPPPHGWPLETLCIILTAFGYFSRLPIPAALSFSEARLYASARYFPVVGWVIGTLAALIYGIATSRLPIEVAVLLSMTGALLATGALHEDGLADCCDGFGGGRQRDDVLRIMKDSRIGAFGAIGLMVSLLLKWQLLVSIARIEPAGVMLWMVAGHAASRAAALTFMTTLDYARAQGKAYAFGRQPWRATLTAWALGLPWMLLINWRIGLTTLVLGALLYTLLRRWFVRRIGGYTGDCLGLAQQLFELMLYLVVIGWISY